MQKVPEIHKRLLYIVSFAFLSISPYHHKHQYFLHMILVSTFKYPSRNKPSSLVYDLYIYMVLIIFGTYSLRHTYTGKSVTILRVKLFIMPFYVRAAYQSMH